MSPLAIDSLPEPGDRFILGDIIGTGVWAQVYKATDTQSGNKNVAIKVQPYQGKIIKLIEEEYRVLRDFSNHPNLPVFYGVYRNKKNEGDEIWFILEYCGGGSVIDLVNRLQNVNKKISEEHIAYILRETAKALSHLHSNHVIHRDVKGTNILITAEGEVKLCDFGLAKNMKSILGKTNTAIGSPSWMAPEIVSATNDVSNDGEDEEDDTESGYGNRADVWALGITAIELGDGIAPFYDMHPTRALFQIVRNPPPTLYRPANWSQNFNDFIAECLEKNWKNRPFMLELLEHPFFTELTGQTGNDHHFTYELKHLVGQVSSNTLIPRVEIAIVNGSMKKFNLPPEKMYVEDLAALEKISEENIVEELKSRLENGQSYTYVGDVLISLNSNEQPLEISRKVHNKYIFKSRSDNAPHIFSVADSAYQDLLHHEEPQHIFLAGESYSGKTTNAKLAMRHLTILGAGNVGVGDRIMKGVDALYAMVTGGTPLNPNSTRCVMQSQMTFGSTGKISGAIFWINLLEKMRVPTTDMNQSNFNIFYYFYDGISATNNLEKYLLEPGRSYRYLRIPESKPQSKLTYYRDDPDGNVDRFAKFEQNLLDLGFNDEQIETLRRILAAILILGNVRYMDDGKFAVVESIETAQKVAKLLNVDEKKFQWALENYCVVQSGTAERRRHTGDEARDARDVLAGTIYSRLVDWIVNLINQKLAFGRAVFGDLHMISITDMFGFECFHRNRTEQLMINSLNEQIQYHYNQRMFVWEMVEQEEEEIPVTSLHYYDNKLAVDHLMSKPKGLFYIIDDASRGRHTHEFITDSVNGIKSTHVQRVSGHEFSVAHYTGKVTYDARELADKNRDFLPPEMVETMRTSSDNAIKLMFTNKLSKAGNLTMAYDDQGTKVDKPDKKSKWGAALVAEKQHKAKKMNTLSHGQYSQVHKMRTLSNVFRATCLEILKGLSIGGNNGNTHFVRCIRSCLDYTPRGFQTEMVYQQIRALAICDTAVARQMGYSQRISFQEFIRRYQFLAFDFDENVDVTKENCRLLLIRLKLEGWIIGKTKVFLKYYNVEYLSRLHETQVKKIIKVQSMMRAFLAKRNVASKLIKFRQESIQIEEKKEPSTNEAAITIQKAFRGYKVRQKYGPLINKNTGEIDAATSSFIINYVKRWKEKTIFQVLLHYRAARYQDLVNISQQIHLYNQRIVTDLMAINNCMILDKIDPKETNPALLGPIRQSVNKLPFRLDDIPYFDTALMCDPLGGPNYFADAFESDEESWDAPLKRNNTVGLKITQATQMPYNQYCQTEISGVNCDFLNEPFTRDPNIPFKPIQRTLPKPSSSNQISKDSNEFQHKIEEFDNKSKTPTVYKKRPAPKPLTNPQSNLESKHSFGKKRQAPLPKPIPRETEKLNQPKLNPVKEMELIARNKSTENEDEAPFNFQGMLRKTKYQRASMKRSIIKEQEENFNEYNNNSRSVTPIDNGYQKRSVTSSPININSRENIIYQSDRQRQICNIKKSNSYITDNSMENMNMNYLGNHYNGKYRSTSSQDYHHGKMYEETNGNNQNVNEETSNQLSTPIINQRRTSLPLSMKKSDLNSDNCAIYVQEEIRPGIILEGYAVEI